MLQQTEERYRQQTGLDARLSEKPVMYINMSNEPRLDP